MEAAELLTVTDSFHIENIGLIVMPDFSVPKTGWKDQSHKVTLQTPSGDSFETEAFFKLCHFYISDPMASIDRRWRVVIGLPKVRKDEVPVGSKLLCSQELQNRLAGNSSSPTQ